MSEQNPCSCGRLRFNLGFACSGASDVGGIADQAARTLAREKTASMCCAAAIAAEVPDVVEKTRTATKIVVIDGCDYDCARKIMEKGRFKEFAYVRLQDLGMEKGKTPVTEENIAKAASAAREALIRQAECTV